MSGARSAAQVAGAQLNEPAPLHVEDVSEGRDHRNSRHEKLIWDLQSLDDQSADSVSSL